MTTRRAERRFCGEGGRLGDGAGERRKAKGPLVCAHVGLRSRDVHLMLLSRSNSAISSGSGACTETA